MASSSRESQQRYERSPESFESLDRRNNAAEILQSFEQLSWMALSRCESIAQTRLYYQAIVAGLNPKDERILPVYWVEKPIERHRKAEDSAIQSSKKHVDRTSGQFSRKTLAEAGSSLSRGAAARSRTIHRSAG